MFKLTEKRSVKWPVTVDVPQDGGSTRPARFTVEFHLLDQSVIDAALTEARGDAEFLIGVMQGWDGVADEDGNPLEFSDASARRVLDIPYVRNAVLRAYFEAVSGGRRKN